MLPINIALFKCLLYRAADSILAFGFLFRIDYLLKVTLYGHDLYKILWWPRMIFNDKI